MSDLTCVCERCQDGTQTSPVGSGWVGYIRVMATCSECGNKRCPKATDHRLDCTRSNKSGQKGSSWEHYDPTQKGEPA